MAGESAQGGRRLTTTTFRRRRHAPDDRDGHAHKSQEGEGARRAPRAVPEARPAPEAAGMRAGSATREAGASGAYKRARNRRLPAGNKRLAARGAGGTASAKAHAPPSASPTGARGDGVRGQRLREERRREEPAAAATQARATKHLATKKRKRARASHTTGRPLRASRGRRRAPRRRRSPGRGLVDACGPRVFCVWPACIF